MDEYLAPRPPKLLKNGANELSVADSFGSLADFMLLDADNDLIALRKFKRLTMCSLLAQQHQLIVLEREVQSWENHAHKRSRTESENESDNEETGEPKQTDRNKELERKLQDAQRLLKDYHEALLRGSQVIKLPPLSSRLVEYFSRLVKTGVRNELGPMVEGDGLSDLAAIAASEKGSIHKYIKKSEALERFFLKPPKDGLPDDIRLYSEMHVRNTETVLINFTFLLLVMIPIVALSYVKSKAVKLVIIGTMVILASVIASGLSDKSHRSSLGVIAGYTAIVVVFLSNNL